MGIEIVAIIGAVLSASISLVAAFPVVRKIFHAKKMNEDIEAKLMAENKVRENRIRSEIGLMIIETITTYKKTIEALEALEALENIKSEIEKLHLEKPTVAEEKKKENE
ncbi:MAG: hypothetical protein MI685_11605 [Chlorobiales bacterium]|nr:hypothetical protein [Chlorobiales bacterium]